jgi:hypothetical protein
LWLKKLMLSLVVTKLNMNAKILKNSLMAKLITLYVLFFNKYIDF